MSRGVELFPPYLVRPATRVALATAAPRLARAGGRPTFCRQLLIWNKLYNGWWITLQWSSSLFRCVTSCEMNGHQLLLSRMMDIFGAKGFFSSYKSFDVAAIKSCKSVFLVLLHKLTRYFGLNWFYLIWEMGDNIFCSFLYNLQRQSTSIIVY